jgi:hypothetical protein
MNDSRSGFKTTLHSNSIKQIQQAKPTYDIQQTKPTFEAQQTTTASTMSPPSVQLLRRKNTDKEEHQEFYEM